MDMLRKYFPYSFLKKDDFRGLVINILRHIVVAAVASIVIWLGSKVPFVGVVISILGSLVGLYILISMILSVLDYLQLLK